MGLDILSTYDEFVYLGRQMLRLVEEEVSLWILGAGLWASNQVVAKDQVISAQCEGVVMARLENPLGMAKAW